MTGTPARSALWALDDGGCREIAERHGTPVFAYHGPTARRSIEELRREVPGRVRIAYAVKANPHPKLLQTFAGLGAGFDCASIGELERVAAVDPRPERVFFAGPGKRWRELERALELGARIQAEGWEDLERLEKGARARVAVNLRVHPLAGVEESRPILGGVGPSVFGIDEEHLPGVVDRAKRLKQVEIRGLHVFAASNERDAWRLLDTYRTVFGIARSMRDLGIELDQIDLGGGLGVPYSSEESPLDVSSLGDGLATILAEEAWFEGEVILEPGRFLSAPCGIYLARVVRVKESRGTRFAILEGGINHLMRPHLTGQPFPVCRIAEPAGSGSPAASPASDPGGGLQPTVLAGPLCTSLDRLGELPLPQLASGDLLAFGMTGAYGFTEGMTHFLSHPVPPEVWIE